MNAAGSLHDDEPHAESTAARLNWLRAGVLGANDGIVSISGLVVGVAAATTSTGAIATAGVAGVVAGAVSMALGEYVSVSTQRDSENALIAKEEAELEEMPEEELEELVALLDVKGLSAPTARAAATEMTQHDALAAHLDVELGLTPEDMANPWAAAVASAIAFVLGSLLPMAAILIPPAGSRIPIAFVGVLVALTLTGALSARLGASPLRPAVVRLVVGGALAMGFTYGIGALLGVSVAG